jgi:hypothetical protein
LLAEDVVALPGDVSRDSTACHVKAIVWVRFLNRKAAPLSVVDIGPKGFSMETASLSWTGAMGWQPLRLDFAPSLVLYFGSRETLADGARYRELRASCPDACLIGCSTDGQIAGVELVEAGISAVAIRFETTTIRAAMAAIHEPAHSAACGEAIGAALASHGLVGILVLSDGLVVNGSDLVTGIARQAGRIPIFGGLAADGLHFIETAVGLNCAPKPGQVAAIGFYGSSLRIGHGSAGGWDVFGPRRRITLSEGGQLIELDGRPALDLYERYLDEEEFAALPGSALLFPLEIHDPGSPDHRLMRSVRAVDHAKRSVSFGGDMPEGWVAQLMRGNADHLAAGAAEAAGAAREAQGQVESNRGVAILVSCFGRKRAMGRHIATEIEAAGAELGPEFARIGFYSYGEISPHAGSGRSELHNQTMTVTTMTER